MRNIFTLALVIFYLASFSQSPSDYKFQSISIAQGLSQSSAYSIFQDHLGYMWIGTQGGMNRFDGYGVKILICLQVLALLLEFMLIIKEINYMLQQLY